MEKCGMAVPGGFHGIEDFEQDLPLEVRQKIVVSIPRNMHHERNAETNKARVAALTKTWDSRKGTLYADGAGPA